MLREIADVQGEVDLTVVILHMGQEYSSTPTQEQRQMVEEAIDTGADVVVCSHSHVVAPYGMLTTQAGATGLVYWGLGQLCCGPGRHCLSGWWDCDNRTGEGTRQRVDVRGAYCIVWPGTLRVPCEQRRCSAGIPARGLHRRARGATCFVELKSIPCAPTTSVGHSRRA